MAPRKYDMSSRKQQVEETRRTIVMAASELHAEQGVLATSWEEIAERADVSPATVYRHFPTLVELIPACARTIFDLIEPPTLEQARANFAQSDPPERLEFLIRNSCVCYAKGEAWLHAARRERDLVPAVEEAVKLQEDSLEVLVKAAVQGAGLRPDDRRVLQTFCDFPFWKSLVDGGLSREAATDVAVEVAQRYLAEHARS